MRCLFRLMIIIIIIIGVAFYVWNTYLKEPLTSLAEQKIIEAKIQLENEILSSVDEIYKDKLLKSFTEFSETVKNESFDEANNKIELFKDKLDNFFEDKKLDNDEIENLLKLLKTDEESKKN